MLVCSAVQLIDSVCVANRDYDQRYVCDVSNVDSLEGQLHKGRAAQRNVLCYLQCVEVIGVSVFCGDISVKYKLRGFCYKCNCKLYIWSNVCVYS